MGNPDRMSGKLTQNCWFGFEGRSARLILISRKNAEDENTAEKKRGGKTHWDFTALFSSIPISHGYCQDEIIPACRQVNMTGVISFFSLKLQYVELESSCFVFCCLILILVIN